MPNRTATNNPLSSASTTGSGAPAGIAMFNQTIGEYLVD